MALPHMAETAHCPSNLFSLLVLVIFSWGIWPLSFLSLLQLGQISGIWVEVMHAHFGVIYLSIYMLALDFLLLQCAPTDMELTSSVVLDEGSILGMTRAMTEDACVSSWLWSTAPHRPFLCPKLLFSSLWHEGKSSSILFKPVYFCCSNHISSSIALNTPILYDQKFYYYYKTWKSCYIWVSGEMKRMFGAAMLIIGKKWGHTQMLVGSRMDI